MRDAGRPMDCGGHTEAYAVKLANGCLGAVSFPEGGAPRFGGAGGLGSSICVAAAGHGSISFCTVVPLGQAF